MVETCSQDCPRRYYSQRTGGILWEKNVEMLSLNIWNHQCFVKVMFTEEDVKFYLAELALALNHLH